MHDEHEPPATDVRFEDVTVLTPKIAGKVKKPPASNAADEGDRTHSGRAHHQAPFPRCASEYPSRARRSMVLRGAIFVAVPDAASAMAKSATSTVGP
jgi:hypothetical protein